MPVALPTEDSRWRCSQCGNLTRFDVTRSIRTVEFWHADLAGQRRVDERHVLEDRIERVRCRWCDAVDSVVLEPRPGAPRPGRAP